MDELKSDELWLVDKSYGMRRGEQMRPKTILFELGKAVVNNILKLHIDEIN